MTEQEKIIQEIKSELGINEEAYKNKYGYGDYGLGDGAIYYKKCHTKKEKTEIIKQLMARYKEKKPEVRDGDFWDELEESINSNSNIYCEEEEKEENGDLDWNFKDIETF